MSNPKCLRQVLKAEDETESKFCFKSGDNLGVSQTFALMLPSDLLVVKVAYSYKNNTPTSVDIIKDNIC